MAKFKFQAQFSGWAEFEIEAPNEEEAYDLANEEPFLDGDWEMSHVDVELIDSPPALEQLAEQAE